MSADKKDQEGVNKAWADRYYTEPVEDWSDRAARKHAESQVERDHQDKVERLLRRGFFFGTTPPGPRG
jgi:SOS response regulatory protein OraA/RecX